jgi:hypothetical protein
VRAVGATDVHRRLGIFAATTIPLLISLAIALENFRYPLAVFRQASDHFSHIGGTLSFLAHGINVYTTPVETLLRQSPAAAKIAARTHLDPRDFFVDPLNANAPPIFINWPQFARPYPPGLYLLLLPVAMLYHLGIIGFVWICRIVILGLLLASAGVSRVTYAFAFESADAWSLVIRFITATVITFWSFYWALAGFYDVIALLLVLISMRALHGRQWIDAMFYFGLASFVHTRALYASPVFLIALRGDWASHERPLTRWMHQPRMWIAAICLTICVISLLISIPDVKRYPQNNIYLHFAGTVFHLGFPMALGILLAVICAAALISQRDWGGLLMLILPWAFMVQTPLLRLWHSIFWLPLLFYTSFDVRAIGRRFVWAATLIMIVYIIFLAYGIDFWLFA